MNNELIEAAKAVIARWDSTDWKAAPTAEVMGRLRAALSAKPAKLPEVEAVEAVNAIDEVLPVGSAEDMQDWLQYNHRYERDGSSTKYTKVFDYKRVEYYLQEITAAHAAELIEVKKQGRREALAYDPPIPAEIKGRVQAEWFWKGVLAMKEQEKAK